MNGDSSAFWFCCVVAVAGAALVVHGVNLQGFVWWFLLCFLIGNLLAVSGPKAGTHRAIWSLGAGFFFILSAIGLYIVLGLLLSGYKLDSEGFKPDLMVVRLKNFLTHLGDWGFYCGIWLMTSLLIWVCASAATYTVKLMLRMLALPDSEFIRVKKKVVIVSSLLTMLGTGVGYFAAK